MIFPESLAKGTLGDLKKVFCFWSLEHKGYEACYASTEKELLAFYEEEVLTASEVIVTEVKLFLEP